MTTPVLFLLSACFLLAIAAWLSSPRLARPLGFLSFLTLTAFFGRLYVSGASPALEAQWVQYLLEPLTGFSISFYIDGLSMVFLSLISGIGALVLIYATGYFKGKDREWKRCLGLLQIFIAGMIGIVTAGNLLFLFIFWEMTTLSSYFLIGFDHEKESARKSALKSLLITGGGGLCLLAGILLLGEMAGTLELPELFATKGLGAHPLAPWSIVLILIGCFAKSAQFPFHGWLPDAMAAPTPVSSYLHSATMVKAGVFLAARLSPLFADSVLWTQLMLVIGTITALLGIVLALRANDLKQVLAYTTVSGLGILFALMGLGSSLAFTAMIVFLIVHALYKAGLFMFAGAIDKVTGTRDLRKLGQLRKQLPALALATFVLCLSMAGVPPLLGFIGKELIYESTFESGLEGLVVSIAMVATMVLTVAVSYFLFRETFLGDAPEKHPPKTLSPAMLIPCVILAAVSLLLGLFPQLVGDFAVAPGLAAMALLESEVKLKLWHGFTWLLGASVVTLAVGALIGYRRRSLNGPLSFFDHFAFLSPDRMYGKVVEIFDRVSTLQTNLFFGGGYLRGMGYLVASLLASLVVILFQFHSTGRGFLHPDDFTEINLFGLLAIILIIVPALVVPYFKSRVSSVIIAGVTGLGVSILFASHGAPDLALTQVLVETFILILFVFVLKRLPLVYQWLPNRKVAQVGALASLTSIAMGVTVYWALRHQGHRPLAHYFIEKSEPEGYGQNVVNVILVDFRAFDTLGEISVLALTTLGIASLIQSARKRSQDEVSNS